MIYNLGFTVRDKTGQSKFAHHKSLIINRGSDGFTLIELLLVLAIVFTVSVIGIAFYSRALVQNSVTNTVDQLVGSIRKAQIYSMMGKQASGWSVNYDNTSNIITLYKGPPPFSARSTPALDEKFNVNPNIIVTGLTDISFTRPAGIPTPLALTVTITGGTNVQTMTVNSQGVVSR